MLKSFFQPIRSCHLALAAIFPFRNLPLFLLLRLGLHEAVIVGRRMSRRRGEEEGLSAAEAVFASQPQGKSPLLLFVLDCWSAGFRLPATLSTRNLLQLATNQSNLATALVQSLDPSVVYQTDKLCACTESTASPQKRDGAENEKRS